MTGDRPSFDAPSDDLAPVDALSVSAAAPIGAARAAWRARRRRVTCLMLLVGVPLLAAVAAAGIYLAGGRCVETDNAYVKADKVPLSAEVSGVVAEIFVRETESVAAGQPLFRLDAAQFRVAVARAEAELAQARTEIAAMKAGYREKQAQLALARTRYEFALKEQRRQTDLAARNFISASRLDDARQATELAQQQIVAQQQDLQRVATELDGGLDAPIERHPTWLAAQAELQQARLELARVEVRASLPGTIGKLPKPGQYLMAGSVAAALVADAEPWVEANFPEKDLTWVRPASQPRCASTPGPTERGTGSWKA